MARYGKKTKLSCKDVIEKAKIFFGPGGVGLEIEECTENCARFTGGGGHVAIECCTGEKGTEIDLETREWDYQVKRFMGKI